MPDRLNPCVRWIPLAMLAAALLWAPAFAQRTLVVAQPTDAGSIDFDRTSIVGRNMGINVYDWQWVRYETLETEDGQLYSHPFELAPGIVTSWETILNDDGSAVQRLTIRDDAVFHSGNPVTVNDLKYSVMRRAALGGHNLHVTVGGMYGPDQDELDATMRIIDDHTMEIDVQRATPSFWETWTQRWYWDSAVMLEHASDDDPWSQEFAAQGDAGSGPYTIASWTPGVEMRLTRFEDYWGPAPAIDEIVFRVVPDVSTRALLLRQGQIDVALELPNDEIEALRGAPGVQVISAPSSDMLAIMMNPNIAPFDNHDLRLALSYAFPYDDIIPGVYSGRAQPFNGPIPTGSDGALEERRYVTDLDRAREHLEAAGFASGLTLTLRYEAGFDAHEQIGILFGENLRQIGVTLNLQRLPAGQFATGRIERTLDFFIAQSLPWITTAEYVFRLSYLENTPSNNIGYRNEIVEELVPLANDEPDADARREMNLRVQDAILDDAVWIYIAQPDFQLAMRDSIVGYVAQNTRFNHWWLVDKVD